jgi:MFS family permease
MLLDATLIVALCAGLVGALTVAAISTRYTRNARALTLSGAFSGIAVGGLTYVLCGWLAHGFDPLQAWVLPLVALILLLVMAAQNWFVFYVDRKDAAQSAQPAIAVFAGALACLLAAGLTGRHSLFFPIIWAASGSLAILLCVPPVLRSIEVNRSVVGGFLIGLAKVVLPLSGVLVFIPIDLSARARRKNRSLRAPASEGREAFLSNLLMLCWEIGLLLPMTLINGARVPPHATDSDPLEYLSKGGASVSGDNTRLRRDSVVLILVLAIHVLCGVVIVKD